MFSKQLEYSYLMYEYIKENVEDYISGEKIIEGTMVPKRWGRVLLSNMASKKIINSTKGKGFSIATKRLTFWQFYMLVEESTKIQEMDLYKKFKNENEKKYNDILLKIGVKVQQEMESIEI